MRVEHFPRWKAYLGAGGEYDSGMMIVPAIGSPHQNDRRTMELKDTLRALQAIESEPCVSILLTTHRTHPDNAQDPINLKNLVAQAEERLLKDYDKRHVTSVLEHINKAVASMDHMSNLEGLALFANSDMAQVVKLNIPVTDRVILGRNFATRDLLRDLQGGSHYYILTVSGHQSRLIEAHRDQVLVEYGAQHVFPIENRQYNTHAAERSQSGVEENLMKEFCNRVDKAMKEVRAVQPLPVIVAGDVRSIEFMLSVVDDRSAYIGSITGSPDDQKGNELAAKAFVEVERIMAERRAKALELIAMAQSAGKLSDDIGDIRRAVKEGRGEALYIEQGYFQPARIDGDTIVLKDDPTEAGVIDDVIDELAEHTLKLGGQVVFLPPGSLEAYHKVCLVLRY
jgi:hypothetical protein